MFALLEQGRIPLSDPALMMLCLPFILPVMAQPLCRDCLGLTFSHLLSSKLCQTSLVNVKDACTCLQLELYEKVMSLNSTGTLLAIKHAARCVLPRLPSHRPGPSRFPCSHPLLPT